MDNFPLLLLLLGNVDNLAVEVPFPLLDALNIALELVDIELDVGDFGFDFLQAALRALLLRGEPQFDVVFFRFELVELLGLLFLCALQLLKLLFVLRFLVHFGLHIKLVLEDKTFGQVFVAAPIADLVVLFEVLGVLPGALAVGLADRFAAEFACCPVHLHGPKLILANATKVALFI